jgi:hypothetical protein
MNPNFRKIFFSVSLPVLCLFTFFSVACAAEKLVAAYYSDRYHVASCKIAKKIHSEDIRLYATPEEAFEAGLAPCKKCNPPVPENFKKAAKNF